MFKKLKDDFVRYLLSFVELQLVISLASLPILTMWGLPISCMSLISNFIFTPLLIIFLWTSCLFSICVLCGISCGWLTFILEKITTVWFFLLSYGRPEWLMGFSKQTLWISLACCAGMFVLYHFFKPTPKRAIGALMFLWLVLLGARWSMCKQVVHCKISNMPLTVVKVYGKTYVIDYGALCSKQNFYTHIDYTLIPALIKNTGTTTIDTLVLCKPSKRLAKIALQFAQQTCVKTIIVTQKMGCFQAMCEACKDLSINIIPLNNTKKRS